MIKPNQLIEIKWSKANKAYFIEKGYPFTRIGDIFYVRPEELPRYSGKEIVVICDYCGKEYKVVYKNYITCSLKQNNKTCCKQCSQLKIKEVNQEKYGVPYYTYTDDFKKKTQQTLATKYEVDNVSQIEWVKERKKKTNLKKFGSEWYVNSNDFRNFCKNKYGTDNPMKNEECKEKAGKTMLLNGNIPVSKEEIKFIKKVEEIFGTENCFPGFRVARYFLDCLLKIGNINIDVEYDGWYWHQTKQNKDKKRNDFLISKGFKVVRFVSKGATPTKKQIKEAINKILKGEKLVVVFV